MVKERYLWIAFVVVIIAAALYYRSFSVSQISLNVSIINHTSSIYPYQSSSIPISVVNTGSAAISNLSFGLYVNGNISRTYDVSLPAGSKALIYYNSTPTSSGSYSVSLVADPAKLYDIADRQNAQASTTLQVLQAEKPEPYVYLPSNGLLGKDMFAMSATGYISSTYLYSNFSSSIFELTGSSNINNFIYPALDVYLGYIKSIYVSHAYYNNFSLVSIWVQGYLNGQSIYEAALGKGLNATYSDNLTFINFGNSSSMCSWYSGGWIKNLISVSGKRCTEYIANTTGTFNQSVEFGVLKQKNISVLNYSGTYQNLTYAGDLAVFNSILMYESLINGENFSNLCYGGISNFSNISYCSTYGIGSGNYILAKVSKIIGKYNVSAWALSSQNSSQIGSDYAFALARSYNISGVDQPYISAFASRCSIYGDFYCYNSTFNSTVLKFSIRNDYDSTLSITSIGCYSGNVTKEKLDFVVAPGASALISTPCYANGQAITGIPLGLETTLQMSYSLNGTSSTAYGYAYIYG